MINHVLCFDYSNQDYRNKEFDLLIKNTFTTIQNYTNIPDVSIPLYTLFISVIDYFKKQFNNCKNLDICITYFDEHIKAENYINSLCINNDSPHNWIISANINPVECNIDALIIYNGLDNNIVINPDFITWKIFMVIEPIEMSAN